MDEPKPKVSGQSRVDRTVGGAKAENELVRTEPALGGAWEVSEGVEENGGSGLDLTIGDATKRDVLDDRDAGERVLLEDAVIDAVEGDDQGKRRRAAAVRHCCRGSDLGGHRY